MTTKLRTAVASTIGIVSALMSFYGLASRGFLASDFQWPLQAGQYLLQGDNPYRQVPTNYQYPYDSLFFYPLPTAIFAIAFVWLDPYVAGALFFGLSSGLLALAILRDNPARLTVFLSANFFIASSVAQWSPLIMAAALLPHALRALAFLKPNLGVVSFVYRPSVKAIVVYLVAIVASMAILPTWPVDWLLALTTSGDRYLSPLLVPGGLLLLLSLLAIRSRPGRVLLALSAVPTHSYWYDGVLLWLIPTTWWQGLLLSVLSWVAYFGWKLSTPEGGSLGQRLNMARPWQVWLMYLPLLAMVLYCHSPVRYLVDRYVAERRD